MIAVAETNAPELLTELRNVPERPVFSSVENIFLQRSAQIQEELRLAGETPVTISPGVQVRRRDLNKVLDEVTSNLKTALAIERPVFEDTQRKVKAELEILSSIKKRTSNLTAAFDGIQREFPNAEIVDLSVVAAYYLPNGLPRLTLLDPFKSPNEQENSIVLYYRSGPQLLDNAAIHADEIKERLITNILAATGCYLYDDDYSPTSQSSLTNPIHVAAIAEAKRRGKLEPEAEALPVPVTRLHLSPEFNGTIPPEFRTLIGKVASSKLFDSVRLLAEVDGWKTSYWCNHADTQKAFIAPNQVFAPEQAKRDPLIVGIKMIDGIQTSFLLGAFNTTPLEDYVRKEWCV